MRTKMIAAIGTALLAGVSLAATSSSPKESLPPLPYEDAGACPFECCSYRLWSVQKDTDILSERRDGAKVLFRAATGTKLTGLSGVVVTTKFGRAEVRKASKVASASLAAGKAFPIMRYRGEGEWSVWIDGKTSSAFLVDAADCRNPRLSKRLDCSVQITERPETTWWVKVRNEDGQEGWSRETDHFGDKDACS